jgi:hypothetical protein
VKRRCSSLLKTTLKAQSRDTVDISNLSSPFLSFKTPFGIESCLIRFINLFVFVSENEGGNAILDTEQYGKQD